ncbi:MAG: hypothetical protein K6G01_02970 [Eubacterium sp.]|nr:hypothetical protein [Eubacterium sp.]
MKTKQIPLIIMLIGGAASSLISVLTGVSSKLMLERLLVTLVVFLVLGGVIQIIVEKNFKNLLEEEKTEETEEITTEDGENEQTEQTEDSVESEEMPLETEDSSERTQDADDEWG